MRDPPELRRPGAAGAGGGEGDQARLKPTPLFIDSPLDAALDVALSHALLNQRREAVRVWTPPPAVSFGRLDLLSPEIDRAAAVARAEGLEPVRRLAGGRAAAVGAGTVCLGFAEPVESVATGMQERYEALSAMLLEALARLGIEARIGELSGEWCAGAWSVLVGDGKVGGLAQRVIRGGAWAEAVLIATGAPELRGALDRVHAALGLSWRSETLVALEGVTVEEVRHALAGAVGGQPAEVPDELWERARVLRAEHAM